jgi:ankyrin repeat protein
LDKDLIGKYILIIIFGCLAAEVWANTNECHGQSIGGGILHAELPTLHESVQVRDKRKLIEAIERGDDLNVRNKLGETLLHVSVRNNFFDIVSILIDAGAGLNIKDKTGQTPLHMAAVSRYGISFRLLVNAGADLDARTQTGQSPLYLLAQENYLRRAHMTLEHVKGIDVEAKTIRDQTPLHAALSRGHVKMVRLLLGYGASVMAKTTDGDSALNIAVKHGNKESVELIIDSIEPHLLIDELTFVIQNAGGSHRRDIRKLIKQKQRALLPSGLLGEAGLWLSNKVTSRDQLSPEEVTEEVSIRPETELLEAVEWGDVETVRILLRKEIDINYADDRGNTALHKSASGTRLDILKLIIETKADPNLRNSQGLTPLQIVIQGRGWFDAANLLLKAGADVNQVSYKGTSLLDSLITLRHLKLIKIFIDRGAKVNTADKFGETPLHKAVKTGDIKIVEMLLETGANLHAHDNDGWTAMSLAIRISNLDLVHYFLDKGVDPNYKGYKNWTYAHDAVKNKNLEILKVLEEAGADLLAVTTDRDSLLHLAVEVTSYKIVYYLLMRGADPNAENINGVSPEQQAFKLNDIAMINILKAKNHLDEMSPVTSSKASPSGQKPIHRRDLPLFQPQTHHAHKSPEVAFDLSVPPVDSLQHYLAHEVNRGGIGIVYLAFVGGDPNYPRAVKLTPHFYRDVLRDSDKSARQAAKEVPELAPFIVSSLSPIHSRSDMAYMVMPWINGLSLSELMKSPNLSAYESFRIFTQIIQHFQMLHQSGLIHGDPKPHNFVVDMDGNVHLIDFAGKKSFEDSGDTDFLEKSYASIPLLREGSSSSLRQETPRYLNPTRPILPDDPDSENYSLGIVFYELLTGNFPVLHSPKLSSALKVSIADELKPHGNKLESIYRKLLESGNLEEVKLELMFILSRLSPVSDNLSEILKNGLREKFASQDEPGGFILEDLSMFPK